MTLGRRHALGLGLLLALVVEPPELQPFVSAQAQQPERGVKEAPLRSARPSRWKARELQLPIPWAMATALASRAEGHD